jgi:hypothetical protein
MSNNILIVTIYHHHNLLDLIDMFIFLSIYERKYNIDVTALLFISDQS